jgi:hypothetical protein
MYSALRIMIVSLLVSNSLLAQESKTGNWLIYFGNQKISNKWNWHNEVQLRNYNFLGDIQQLLLRTGIGYNLTENNNNLLLGYGFIHNQKYVDSSGDKVKLNEHRIFQQFITRQNFGRVNLQHRYRAEERFLPNDFQMRFRYFLSVNIPLNKKTMDKNAVYLSAYNELFINAEKTLFDRNRLYGALGYVVSKNIKIEAGFMTQTSEATNTNQFQIVVFNNLNFNNN